MHLVRSFNLLSEPISVELHTGGPTPLSPSTLAAAAPVTVVTVVVALTVTENTSELNWKLKKTEFESAQRGEPHTPTE